MKSISLVIPIYNEEENIKPLFREIEEVMSVNAIDYEIIAINDGSFDSSGSQLREEAKRSPYIKIISLNRNYGQTAAMSAGFHCATHGIVIPLDADMQNDPRDIPRLIEVMDSGFDIVSGWRKERKDKTLSRKIPSWIANSIISRITGVHLHDYGCTLKVYKKEILDYIKLYGEMHRFIPALAVWQGARITEVAVNHRERKRGKTKYGITRTFRVVLDLLTVKFLTKFSTKPMHFFGGAGIMMFFFGAMSAALALYLRFSGIASLIQTPLPLLSAFFFIVGIQFALMGLLAEMIMRNYFESQNKPTYIIKEKINF